MSQLPTLPVPPLAQTLAKYERSLEPLLNAHELREARQLIAKFASSDESKALHARLLALRDKCDAEGHASWLSDIWLRKAYLEWREPSFVNSNWSMILRPHPFGARSDPLARAALLVRRLAVFRRLVERHELHSSSAAPASSPSPAANPPANSPSPASPANVVAAKAGAPPLCMDQYRRVFGTTRIPMRGCDAVRVVPALDARHIVVLCRDYCYVVDVCAPQSIDPLSAAEIYAHLRAAVDDAHKRTDPAIPVAVHTTANRDDATRTRQALLDAGNAAALDTVERAMLCLSLDDSEPLDDAEIGLLTHTNVDGRNRWFDKAVSLVVFANGAAGVCGEHSPQDAPVPGHAIEYALLGETVDEYRALLTAVAPSAGPPRTTPPPRRIQWHAPLILRASLEQHRQRAASLAANLDMFLFCFESFGSAALKTLHVSPDSFVQIAFQLAFYRLHGRVCATYETCATRRFRFGRTECGRSCTPESLAFVACADNAHATHDERRARFLLAMDAHQRYIKEASAGHGVDRHLLGLRCMVASGEHTPALFQHVSYTRSTDFQMSTSNVSMGNTWLALFAPVTEHGYGLPYTVRQNAIYVNVTTWNSSHFTPPASAFATVLGGAFRNLYSLLSAPHPKL